MGLILQRPVRARGSPAGRGPRNHRVFREVPQGSSRHGKLNVQVELSSPNRRLSHKRIPGGLRVKAPRKPNHRQVEIELEKATARSGDGADLPRRRVVTPRGGVTTSCKARSTFFPRADRGFFLLAVFLTPPFNFMRSLLLPLVLALLLSYLLRPIVRAQVGQSRSSQC